MHRSLFLPLALAALASLGPAVAADELSSADLQICQQLADAAERLQCFDALAERVLGVDDHMPDSQTAAAPIPAVPAASAAVAVAEEPVPVIESEAVGTAGRSAAIEDQAEESFGRREEPEKPEAIQTVIEKTDKTAYGKLILYLDNGQIWQQLDSLRTTFKAGDEIIISSAVSGSFLLRKTTGGTRIRVRRVDV